ncbi:DUF4251 domain-containing protein [Ancylomarina sp. 16SWW S1-10-2]|uniref:DUF4251 domain-containing protein n=1 Tax=Ancylomarina sp. 16SWW S1-10-2 TaxID=2499681 RepID=UPI0012ADE8A6|nr:DUF4251 domain-containing protein [Ancylomarina sp. 16SWW S1-10-2]MRT93569.1 DUF4251 domain-containing protein [Ancylomarina sp. 16SWW S1-10-2]
MKSILKKLIASLLLIVLVTEISAQNKLERRAKKLIALQESVQLIKSGEFKFEAKKAYPQGGSSIDLTTNYGFVTISENKSEADLPFFGRAYQLKYGGDGGMIFKGEILNEKFNQNSKKNKFTYTFEVRDKELFKVILEAFSNESVSVIIQCSSRAHISYSGRIIELKKGDLTNK